MTVQVTLPQVGESVTEGIISKWLCKVGDRVEKYDPLVEIVTDKVTMEVPSPYAGILSAILVEEGVTIPIGTPMLEIETEGQIAESELPNTVTLAPEAIKPDDAIASDNSPKAISHTPDTTPQRHSPAVRRLAEEHGVNLSQVLGTGLGGRITREDVLGHIADHNSAATPTTGAVSVETGTTAIIEAGPDEEYIKLTPLRRIIADNMVKSTSQIPSAWMMLEVDLTSLDIFRKKSKDDFYSHEGYNLTLLPFFIKAVVQAIQHHPMVNSSWGGDKIILKKLLNIGIAVATPRGLVVPVLHNAETYSIAGLAKASKDIIQRAQDNKLTLTDVQGGTFTLNNTGPLGSVVSQPIINYPQAAIVTTEAIIKRPVVLPDDTIAIRTIMNIGITFDHRILDGRGAISFLKDLRKVLETMDDNTPIY